MIKFNQHARFHATVDTPLLMPISGIQLLGLIQQANLIDIAI